MARRKKGRRKSRLRRQVDLEARIRYGPQKRALRELLDEAYQTLKTTAETGEGAARGVRAAVNAAKPQINKIYADAHGSQAESASDVRRDLSMLSSAADPYKAVSAREAGGAKRRLAESLAGASKELVDRGVQAEQGRAYAVTNAVRTHNTEVARIGRDQRGLARDIGDFKSLTYGNLKQARADERAALRKENRDYGLKVDALGLTERNTAATERRADAEITGIDPVTGKRTAGERERRRKARGEKKDKKFTPIQLRDARAQWRRAGVLLDVVEKALKKRGGLTSKTGNAAVGALVRKGIHEPIARGYVQTRLYGGVRAPQRKRLQRDYGLRPKVRRPRGKRYGHLPPVARGILE